MPRPVDNPANRFRAHAVELDPGVDPGGAELVVREERARSILSRNDSPDLTFRWSANAYRGCFHACAYCYARPSHAYLDEGTGTDFDRHLVAKVNAPELLREALLHPRWKGETIVFSGNTDPYQPLEARYALTRKLLEVCLEFRNPVAVITKSLLVARDKALLAELARDARCVVTVSCAFSSDEDARALEPFAPPPSKRFALMRELHEAGVPVAVSLAPTILGLNDSQIPEVLARAAGAGASSAFHTLLRLPLEVEEVFTARLREAFPLRADKVLSSQRQVRNGELHSIGFGDRMRGEGARWKVVERLFQVHAARHGFDPHRFAFDEGPSPFTRPPAPGRQLGLFDE